MQAGAGVALKGQDDLNISANGSENDNDYDIITANITGNITLSHYRGQEENGDDGITGNLTVSTNRSENENEGGNLTGNVTMSGNRGESDDNGRTLTGGGDDRGERGNNYFGRSHQPNPPAVSPNSTPSSNATIVSYSQVIQPILNQRCNSCHPKPGVNLSTYAGTKAAVSLLPGMGQGYLSSAELQSLMNWIKQGALNN